jgi:hypothetical protein
VGDPQMMFQVTLYRDQTFTVDGFAADGAIPYLLRELANAIDNGAELVEVPMN